MSYSYNCVICNEDYIGFGHNPYPVKNSGGACEFCNSMTIIPARQAEKLKKKTECKCDM